MKFEQVLLASDLDGTLLDDERQISRENQQALQYFAQNGGTFIIATGRAKGAAAHFLPDLPIDGHDSIILDGAMIYNYPQKQVKQVYTMPEASLDMLTDVLHCFPHTAAEIYTGEQVYVLQENQITQEHFATIKIPYEKADWAQLPPVSDWFKVNFTDDPEKLKPVKAYLDAVYGKDYSMVSSVNIFYEITHPKATKGEALRTVAQIEGKPYTYAIGDHFNDISMLDAATMSFAPANAQPLVREKADRVVRENNQHALRDVVAYLDEIYG